MELDITALDMLPAQEESPLYPCKETCPRTCARTCFLLTSA
ncbi:ALQxL family class IV lanthipeptide [Streptosporangium jomthongense]|uniref:ALQxL family class IV lanthipeptide n=1 Tax=Streptosporangium jomthongense TaxID=1193683 RepID=A0ABV8ESQ3_9ACTN